MTISEFYFVLSPILCALNDAHTTIALSEQENSIDLPLRWIDGELICVKKTEMLQCGDIVIGSGDKDIEECIEQIENTIPAENEYWKNKLTCHYLQYKSYLNHVNGSCSKEVAYLKIGWKPKIDSKNA